MEPIELRENLTGAREPLETLVWLRDTFLPVMLKNLNTTDVRRRLGIYGGEKIPENERNLTDTRNRVSLVAEYEIARIATRLLEHAKITDLFWSYVVANRFPDLEVRHDSGKRGLRIEVKCLQTIAEEKSANFDTLRKDIHPKTDFLVVVLWEWRHDPTEVTWDRAPQFLKMYVFHAASLAELRDWYWLNRPPANLGDGLQGYDLCFGINCANGKYNEEEGNYGKITRLWKEGFPHRPKSSILMDQTIGDYLVFKTEAITSGLDTLANRLLPGITGDTAAAVIYKGERVGWKAGNTSFLLGSHLSKKADKAAILTLTATPSVYVLSDKYAWVEYSCDGGELEEIRRGKKPKRLIHPLPSPLPLPFPQSVPGQGES